MNCGFDDHSDLCLCDVTPKGVGLANIDYVRDMWHGKALCAVRGHGAPWTRNGILDYFQELLYAYDRWREDTDPVPEPQAQARDAKQRMRWLALNTDMGPTAVVRKVEQELGVRFHMSAVTQIRRRSRMSAHPSARVTETTNN